jgi:hypothetical protein
MFIPTLIADSAWTPAAVTGIISAVGAVGISLFAAYKGTMAQAKSETNSDHLKIVSDRQHQDAVSNALNSAPAGFKLVPLADAPCPSPATINELVPGIAPIVPTMPQEVVDLAIQKIVQQMRANQAAKAQVATPANHIQPSPAVVKPPPVQQTPPRFFAT